MEPTSMAARVRKLERWQDDMVQWQHSMVEWRKAIEDQTTAIHSMVEIFQRIESSLWLFVRLGKVIKWVAGIFAALGVIVFGIKHL